jgi:hypothetical protein
MRLLFACERHQRTWSLLDYTLRQLCLLRVTMIHASRVCWPMTIQCTRAFGCVSGLQDSEALTVQPGDLSYSTDWFHTSKYLAKSEESNPRPARPYLGGSTTRRNWISFSYSSLNSSYFSTVRLDPSIRESTRLKARGLRATCPSVFSQDFAGLFDEDFWLTLNLNCQFELRLRGYIHVGWDFCKSHSYIISSGCLRIFRSKIKEFKIDLSLNPGIDVRLGATFHMECDFSNRISICFFDAKISRTKWVLLKTFKGSTQGRLGTTREDFKTTCGVSWSTFQPRDDPSIIEDWSL